MFFITQHTEEKINHNQPNEIRSLDQLASELRQYVSLARITPTVIRVTNSSYSSTKLVALDLDGTLTSVEYMNRLAEFTNNSHILKSLTNSAIEGKVQWGQNFIERVKLLKGLPVEIANNVANEIPLATGAKEFIDDLKNRGISIIIITGAYQGLAEAISKKLQIDEIYSSQFEIKNDLFTGEIKTPFLTPENKAKKLMEIISRKGFSPIECTAIGDSYNDIPMLSSAGQALIYHAIQKAPLPLTFLTQFI